MGEESQIESKVCKYAKAKGCYVRKFKSPGNRGSPDRIFLTPFGRIFFIEFKALGKEPTPLQVREIKEIISRKGNAYWADSVQVGKAIVDSHL